MTKLWAALAIVVSFVAGIVTNDFVEFRSNFRSQLGSEIQGLDTAASQMDGILTTYFEIASGATQAREGNIVELRSKLRNVQQEAKKVADRLPIVTPEYQALDAAIADVITTSETISTADKNKPFIQSVVRLVEASDEFRQNARELQGRYLTGIPLLQRFVRPVKPS